MIKKKITLLFVSAIIFVCASCFAACGHVCSFGEWQIEKAATCVEKGYRVRTCSHPDCGKQEREEIGIDLQSHALTPVSAVDADCTTDGNVAYNHCSLCDKDFDEDGNELTAEDKIVHAAHKTVDIEEVAASEHNSGTRAYKHCSACKKDFDENGNELTAQDLVVSAKHTMSEVTAIAASEHKDGQIAHIHCNDCGKNLDENGNELTAQDLVVAAKHTMSEVTAIAASEHKNGQIAHIHCNDCGKNLDVDGNELTAQDLIVSAKHTMSEVTAIAASEHKDGQIAHIHCNDCGKNFDEDGNELTAQDLVVAATHTDYDRGTLYCETCAEYIITNVEQFKLFRDTVNGGEKFSNQTVALDADLDLNNEEWAPINGFYGTFDGRDHVIKNLKISSGDNVGLFGRQWQIKAVISNFTIDGADITGGSCVAAVLGQTASTQVTGVTVKNARISAAHYAAGIVGYAYAEISDCNVDGLEIVCVPDGTEGAYDNGDKVGSIVGYLCSGGVENCKVANVTLKGYRDIGGIAGTATAAEGAVYVRNNTVTNANICADQITNHYGNKDANAAEVVGRVIGAVEIENNAHSGVEIELKLNA